MFRSQTETSVYFLFFHFLEHLCRAGTKGNALRDEPADILVHELVGHAIPRIQGKGGTGNAITNENKVRAELKGRSDLQGGTQQREIKKNTLDEAHIQ